MQFQTSDEHPNSSQGNCFLPTTLSGESAASSETCLEQGLFGRNSRLIPHSPRLFRFWRSGYTSRHELLFFPNDELDESCEDEGSCDWEEDSQVETWGEATQIVKEVDRVSVSQDDIHIEECESHLLDRRHSSNEESCLIPEESFCVSNKLTTE
ncbi:hypothetical protein GpartN1_g4219.t1 [Galdieria partita]|uniref:Uncharacterized protein n=1 Tax=Galdieria partita TaxID=83374 RepID=A0A9C7UR04_9RHOD|nr:hypothetical protein GpartN1_g4219.t1 [Galdieria partita]